MAGIILQHWSVVNPTYGATSPVASGAMPAQLRLVVADNLNRLKKYRADTHAEIGRRGKLSAGSVHRLLHGEAATLDMIEGAARAYGLPPWALLVEGLDPLRPPRLEEPIGEDARTKAAAWDELARLVSRLPPAADAQHDGSRHDPGTSQTGDARSAKTGRRK